MPRIYTLLTPRMTQPREIAHAVAASGSPLEHRMERDSLHAVLHRDGVVVLTIVHPRPVPIASEVERLLPGVTPPPGTAWWTDVVVPPERADEAVEVIARLAVLLDGIAVDTASGWDT